MQDLKELVQIVNRYKTRKLEIIGNVATTGKKENVYQEFYKLLCAGKFNNDQEAAEHFGYKKTTDKGYRRLKAGLKKRIINASILIDYDQPIFSERLKIFNDCSKIWLTITTLNSNSAHDLATELAEGIVKDLEKIEATGLLYQVLDFIKIKAAFVKGDHKKLKYYSELSDRCLVQLQEEHTAKDYYSKMIIHVVNSKKYNKETISEIRAYELELNKLKNENSTGVFLIHYYFIAIACETMSRNFEIAIKVCENAINEFGNKKYHSSRALGIFYHQKIFCLISLNKFEEAEKIALQCTALLQPGSFNWFKDRELIITLYIHQSKFNQAWISFNEATAAPNFSSLNEQNKQQWKLIEAWLNFFIQHGLITINKEAAGSKKKFRVNKFLNEVPLFSKDKSGMNIQLIILQILFALQNKNYSLISDRIDALKKYQSRYIKKDDNYRSNIMIRMLIAMTTASFNKTTTLQKTDKLWSQLQNVPSNLVDTNIHTEKVPYEMVWNFILEYLDDKMH